MRAKVAPGRSQFLTQAFHASCMASCSKPGSSAQRTGTQRLRAARAHALVLGRGHALPEDVQALFPAVSEHRLVGEADASTATLAREILHAVAID